MNHHFRALSALVVSLFLCVTTDTQAVSLDKQRESGRLTWAALEAALLAGTLKEPESFIGNSVSFRGGKDSSTDPMTVSAAEGKITCIVRLNQRRNELKHVAQYQAATTAVDVLGKVLRIDVARKRVEVQSIHSFVYAAN